MFIVFVVRRVELCDDADCICCMCPLMGNLSLNCVEGNRNKVSFRKGVSCFLPKMNYDTRCSMLGGEFVHRRDMEVGRLHSNFGKSSVKAGWLMVEIRWL